VKNGKSKAHIEIELKVNERGSRTVFHRSFDKTGKQSFSVDGKKVTEKVYIERIHIFNIQVDNLCMFLPQDRVQDFTKLNSQELLHNTQISVCTPDINERFESLKKKREDQKNSAKQNAEIQVQLNDNINRNQQLHAIIENGKTKEKLIEQHKVHLMKKTWLEFDALKAKFDEADNDLKRLQATVANKKAALVPLERKQKEISGAKINLKSAISNSSTKTLQIINEVGQMTSKIETISSEIRESKQKLKNIFANAQMHAKEVKDLQLRVELDKNEFGKIQNQLKESNVEAIITQLDQQARQIKNHIEALARKMDKTNSKMDQEIVPAINNAKRKIAHMNDSAKQRLQVLRHHFEDAFKAYEWLRNNRHQFQGHIFDPIIIEISVTQRDFAKYVENTISHRDMQAFLCTNKEDMSKLIKIFRNDHKWKVNVAYTEPGDELTFQSPRDINAYNRNFGIYAYLLDMIEGPAPVLNYLCKLFRIHAIVVGDHKLDNHASKLPEDIRVFFSSNNRYSVTISRYSGNKSVSSDEIYPRNMLVVGMDQEELDQAQNT
jgi:structural maintenance of chromosomes protein 5